VSLKPAGLACSVALLMGCAPSCGQPSSSSPSPSDAGLTDSCAQSSCWDRDASAPEADAPDGLAIPDVNAPDGWHRWPFTPDDTAIFVPDDISTIEGITWEPCPFQPQGCEMAGSPWKKDSGWGFGTRILVAEYDGGALLSVGRRRAKDWNESAMLLGGEVVSVFADHRTLSLGHVTQSAGADGKSGAYLFRFQKLNSPYAYISSPETMMTSPERTEFFDASVNSSSLLTRSERLLVMWEAYGSFAVRDLETGNTVHPEPDQHFVYLEVPTPVRDAVIYEAWTGYLGSIWVWSADGQNTAILGDDTYSYDFPATDGSWLVWNKGIDFIQTNQFETVELWVSPIGQDVRQLQPRKLATVPAKGLTLPAIGHGWVVVRISNEETRLYRVSDGFQKYIPTPSGLGFQGNGGYQGMAIADGKVWISAAENPSTNNADYIVRYDIESLPDY